MHSTDTRKIKILEILKRDKSTTVDRIAAELDVSYGTIKIDLLYLRKAYFDCISVVRGRYNGGIFWTKED